MSDFLCQPGLPSFDILVVQGMLIVRVCAAVQHNGSYLRYEVWSKPYGKSPMAEVLDPHAFLLFKRRSLIMSVSQSSTLFMSVPQSSTMGLMSYEVWFESYSESPVFKASLLIDKIG